MLTGRVTESSASGLRVSLEFFEDVVVPSTMLQEPSLFLPSVSGSASASGGQAGGMWIWKYGNDEEEGAEARTACIGVLLLLLLEEKYLLLLDSLLMPSLLFVSICVYVYVYVILQSKGEQSDQRFVIEKGDEV